MRLNLVQFNGLPVISRVSAELGGDAVIVSGASRQELSGKNFGTKFLSCKVLGKKDNPELQKARNNFDFVAVWGNSTELCSWAANMKGIDLLLQPFNSEKCFLDLQTANVLRDNNVFVGVLFSDFLEANGMRQAQLMKNAAMCIKILENAGAKVLLFSGAKNEFQLRASKDLSSFGAMLGMKKENAMRSVRDNSGEFLRKVKA